jgi:cytoskeletal protein RodZ
MNTRASDPTNRRAANRREAGMRLISTSTKVMAVGAIALTGSVAVLADHIYNVQHAATTTQTSSSGAISSTSGDDVSGLQSAATAPSSSSSQSSTSSSGSTAVVSGGS